MPATAFTFDEYQEIYGGSWDDDPTETELHTPYKTYLWKTDDEYFALFKAYLTAGKIYTIFFETKITLEDFSWEQVNLFYWKPSDWSSPLIIPGYGNFNQTYKDEANEDVSPYSLPYDYKLNEWDNPLWIGGRRYKFTPDETGRHVFMGYEYHPGGPH